MSGLVTAVQSPVKEPQEPAERLAESRSMAAEAASRPETGSVPSLVEIETGPAA